MKSFLKLRFVWVASVFCGFGFLALSAASAADTAQKPSPVPVASTGVLDRIETQLYKCPGHNVHLHVTYIQTGGGNAYAVMQVEGKQISMSRQPVPPTAAAAPVAKGTPADAPMQKYYYLSLDPDNSYRWYPEGDTAVLTFLSSGSGDKEQTVYADCAVVQK